MPKKKIMKSTNVSRQYCEVRPVECDGSCKYAKGKKREGC